MGEEWEPKGRGLHVVVVVVVVYVRVELGWFRCVDGFMARDGSFGVVGGVWVFML